MQLKLQLQLKSSHIAPILRSLHWLKINECVEYKLLSLTYEVHFDKKWTYRVWK